LKTRDLLQASEVSTDCTLLSSFCDD